MMDNQNDSLLSFPSPTSLATKWKVREQIWKFHIQFLGSKHKKIVEKHLTTRNAKLSAFSEKPNRI